MTHATAPDLGPLAWVKGEVDAALQRAAAALAQAGAADAAARIQFAQTHLHQVRGALSIIGLDGLSRFTEAAEQLLGDMARGAVPADAGTIALGTRAVASIGNYVDEIAHGTADQPLRLAPLYGEIAAARGQAQADAADLFYPDLSRRPPRRTEPAAADAEAVRARLRGARARFERGLLEWLRGADGRQGAQAMRDAIAEVEAVQATPASRSLWWASLAFFDALIAGRLPADAAVKRLCAQIDAQFRRLMGGTPTAAERLLRDLLYRIARAPADTAHQRAVRDCWQLDALLPDPAAPVSDVPLAPLLAALQARLAAVREHWDEFSGGTAIALARFDEQIEALAGEAAPLGRPPAQRLIAGLLELARWLRRDPLQCSDALALEVAGALLLLDGALERRPPDADFAAQADATLARLGALRRGEAPPPAAGTATAAPRRAQEQAAVAQLSKEMLASLAQVEQTLDDYFRNQDKRAALAQLQHPLQQIVGALGLLGDDDALALVRDAAARIAAFADADADAAPATAEFEALAHRLSALGFHLEALPRGGSRLRDFLEPGADRAAADDEADEAVAPAPAPVVAEAAPPAPEPEAAVPAIAEEDGADEIDLEEEDLEADLEVLSLDAAPPPPPPLPAAPIPASAADIDAELLAIFIDEATEVLATIRERLELARTEPAEREHLVTIRRGFHTLKGSGRMVGLGDIGEAAWGLEQTLNRWLQLDWPLTPALLHLVDAAQQRFAAWVAQLAAGGAQGFDVGTVLAEAERLRAAETPPAAPAALAEHEAAAEPAGAPDFPLLDLSDDGEILPLLGEAEAPPPPVHPAAAAPAEAAAVAEDAIPEEAAAATAQADAEAPAGVLRIGAVEISPSLYALYRTEAAEHLATLAQEFERLAANPALLPSEHALRAAHTLAGVSSTAGIAPVHALGRALEHALERLRELPRAAEAAEHAIFAAATDALRAMLAEVAAQRMPAAAPELVAALDAHCRERRLTAVPATPATAPAAPDGAAAAAGLAAPPHDDVDAQLLPIFLDEAAELLGRLHATLRGWKDAPAQTEPARAVARLLHSLKGSARMAGAMTLGGHLHQLESRLEDGLSDRCDVAALIDELAFGLDVSERMIDGLAAGEAAPAAAAAPATTAAAEAEAGAATLRVRADRIDRFVSQAGEIGIARTRIEGELRTLRRSLLDLTENVIRLRNQLREVELQADVQMQSRLAEAESRHTTFDPLEMDRYTRLQELTRMMAESVNDVTTVQQTLLHNLDGADIALNGQARMARELQQALMQVRMLPFDSLADRLYRVVRQSARELGKRATLDLRGGRIEIDRSVLEQMAAPLEHLLRNAVAHGIEAPAARAAAGKPETGRIVLALTQEGNEIPIEIPDDGAGLDFERIAARARAAGLLGADEQAAARRLTSLIFVAGFSTAGALSAVSGRGVGMDVVKSQTAAAGGRIDVASESGHGTTVRIHLPLTLAVMPALLVRAGGRTWAIPSNMIAQALELKADALRRVQAERGIDWEGGHYAYRYLPRLLGDRAARPEEQRYNWLLLLRAGAQTLALHVDGLRGNQEIVVKNAGPQLARIAGMSGATVLGDGEIVLILNPVALAGHGAGDAGEDAQGPAPEAPLHVPTVMVVDDSLTVRKITGRLLEREGYRVLTAKDGVDALEQLVDTVPDVLLSDIEMPRMDGFDLVRNLRADARTRALPVIMITSRLADKHRRYAQEIGADHYLGKPYQEEELLTLVARYAGRSVAPAAATA